MASSLGGEFDLPLSRVLHGFAATEQRKVQFLLVNTEVRPPTNCHQSLETVPLFTRLIPWRFTRRSVRLPV
jgi:hypothetical protein